MATLLILLALALLAIILSYALLLLDKKLKKEKGKTPFIFSMFKREWDS